MANQTTHLDTIQSTQSQKEVTANALFDAASPATAFGRRAQTTTGLTWGYYGGITILPGSPTVLSQVANGTVALTASQINYVQMNPTTGAISKNTTGFTHGWIPLAKVTCGAASITDYEDWRYFQLGTTP